MSLPLRLPTKSALFIMAIIFGQMVWDLIAWGLSLVGIYLPSGVPLFTYSGGISMHDALSIFLFPYKHDSFYESLLVLIMLYYLGRLYAANGLSRHFLPVYLLSNFVGALVAWISNEAFALVLLIRINYNMLGSIMACYGLLSYLLWLRPRPAFGWHRRLIWFVWGVMTAFGITLMLWMNIPEYLIPYLAIWIGILIFAKDEPKRVEEEGTADNRDNSALLEQVRTSGYTSLDPRERQQLMQDQ